MSNNNNKRVGPFNSYKSLFRIQHVIYRLGNIHLWGFGVSFDQMITGAVAGIFLWFLYTLFPLLNYLPINKWIVIIAGILASMWASARYELGGKSILMWTIGIISWAFRRKYFVRGIGMKKPNYRKERIHLHAACRVVSALEDGTLRCMSPCIVDFKDIDFVDINSPHKISVNPRKRSMFISQRRKQHKQAVQHEEMILMPKNQVGKIYTPEHPIRMESVQILSQPAPSPKKVKRHKAKYDLAWYVGERKL